MSTPKSLTEFVHSPPEMREEIGERVAERAFARQNTVMRLTQLNAELYAEIVRLRAFEPQSSYVYLAYCDCCKAPVPFDHVCSCEDDRT